MGALTPFLWGFEAREILMEFYVKGFLALRMHAKYFRPGGVTADLPRGLLTDVKKFVDGFSFRLAEMEELLTNNRIGGTGCVI